MTATAKPARTMTITNPAGTTYVTVTEGRKQDTYRVEAGYATVKWTHTGDAARGGIVCVNGAGKATGCDCKAALYGKTICRHRQGTEALIARGVLDMPVVSEANDAMADRPEGWLASVE